MSPAGACHSGQRLPVCGLCCSRLRARGSAHRHLHSPPFIKGLRLNSQCPVWGWGWTQVQSFYKHTPPVLQSPCPSLMSKSRGTKTGPDCCVQKWLREGLRGAADLPWCFISGMSWQPPRLSFSPRLRRPHSFSPTPAQTLSAPCSPTSCEIQGWDGLCRPRCWLGHVPTWEPRTEGLHTCPALPSSSSAQQPEALRGGALRDGRQLPQANTDGAQGSTSAQALLGAAASPTRSPALRRQPTPWLGQRPRPKAGTSPQPPGPRVKQSDPVPGRASG